MTTAPPSVRPGWYPCPQTAGILRYHDGATWTTATTPIPQAAPAAPVGGAGAPVAPSSPALTVVFEPSAAQAADYDSAALAGAETTRRAKAGFISDLYDPEGHGVAQYAASAYARSDSNADTRRSASPAAAPMSPYAAAQPAAGPYAAPTQAAGPYAAPTQAGPYAVATPAAGPYAAPATPVAPYAATASVPTQAVSRFGTPLPAPAPGPYGAAAPPQGWATAVEEKHGPRTTLHWILPVGRSGMSIAAGYVGLVATILWVLGPVAILLGVLGLKRARNGGRGSGRCWYAVVVGVLGTIASVLLAVNMFLLAPV